MPIAKCSGYTTPTGTSFPCIFNPKVQFGPAQGKFDGKCCWCNHFELTRRCEDGRLKKLMVHQLKDLARMDHSIANAALYRLPEEHQDSMCYEIFGTTLAEREGDADDVGGEYEEEHGAADNESEYDQPKDAEQEEHAQDDEVPADEARVAESKHDKSHVQLDTVTDVEAGTDPGGRGHGSASCVRAADEAGRSESADCKDHEYRERAPGGELQECDHDDTDGGPAHKHIAMYRMTKKERRKLWKIVDMFKKQRKKVLADEPLSTFARLLQKCKDKAWFSEHCTAHVLKSATCRKRAADAKQVAKLTRKVRRTQPIRRAVVKVSHEHDRVEAGRDEEDAECGCIAAPAEYEQLGAESEYDDEEDGRIAAINAVNAYERQSMAASVGTGSSSSSSRMLPPPSVERVCDAGGTECMDSESEDPQLLLMIGLRNRELEQTSHPCLGDECTELHPEGELALPVRSLGDESTELLPEGDNSQSLQTSDGEPALRPEVASRIDEFLRLYGSNAYKPSSTNMFRHEQAWLLRRRAAGEAFLADGEVPPPSKRYCQQLRGAGLKAEALRDCTTPEAIRQLFIRFNSWNESTMDPP